jgi:hypothetical protein
MAERQTGHRIKRVRTDNAFNSARWKEYFKSHGIIHEPTAPYSSAENGLAERAIRTITEDIRTLLSESGLSHKYWAAAGAVSVTTCTWEDPSGSVYGSSAECRAPPSIWEQMQREGEHHAQWAQSRWEEQN